LEHTFDEATAIIEVSTIAEAMKRYVPCATCQCPFDLHTHTVEVLSNGIALRKRHCNIVEAMLFEERPERILLYWVYRCTQFDSSIPLCCKYG
jgi:hypothetical protein